MSEDVYRAAQEHLNRAIAAQNKLIAIMDKMTQDALDVARKVSENFVRETDEIH